MALFSCFRSTFTSLKYQITSSQMVSLVFSPLTDPGDVTHDVILQHQLTVRSVFPPSVRDLNAACERLTFPCATSLRRPWVTLWNHRLTVFVRCVGTTRDRSWTVCVEEHCAPQTDFITLLLLLLTDRSAWKQSEPMKEQDFYWEEPLVVQNQARDSGLWSRRTEFRYASIRTNCKGPGKMNRDPENINRNIF